MASCRGLVVNFCWWVRSLFWKMKIAYFWYRIVSKCEFLFNKLENWWVREPFSQNWWVLPSPSKPCWRGPYLVQEWSLPSSLYIQLSCKNYELQFWRDSNIELDQCMLYFLIPNKVSFVWRHLVCWNLPIIRLLYVVELLEN